MYLLLKLLLLIIITLINLRGVATAGHVELFLTLIKILVLFAIPTAALFFFDKNNFIVSKEISNFTISQILARSTLLTLWCFIGVELATVPAGSVDNPIKTIPKAIVFGTICVVGIYFINNFAIMGLINGNDSSERQVLMQQKKDSQWKDYFLCTSQNMSMINDRIVKYWIPIA